MASSSSLLSEEQFCCPICLDVFTQPVSTPCGHNFCKSCISTYWDNAAVCQCPVCKETFTRRPDLKVNTFISELASQFMSFQVTDPCLWMAEPQQVTSGGSVLCDVCSDSQKEAVKSCVECQTSYCAIHLEPHHRVAGLKRHTLVQPVASLQDRVCKEHNKLLTLFCLEDDVLLCDGCARSHHHRHSVIPMQEASEEAKGWLRSTEAKVQQMIQERLKMVRDMKESLSQSERQSKEAIAESVQGLTELVSEIQKTQAELIRVIEEKQKSAAEQAHEFISDLEREITELQKTASDLRELKQTQDQLRLFQSHTNPSVLPHIMDLTSVRAVRQLEVPHIHRSVRKSVSNLQVLLNKLNTEIKKFSEDVDASNEAMLRYVQQYEVNVVLDPSTAHPLLILSDNGKRVRYAMGFFVGNQHLNPNTFSTHLAVLGQRGFSSSKFYFEVNVGRKTEWCLGVATASLQRWGEIPRRSDCGLWALSFLEDKFETFHSPNVPVYVGKVERVGVFVDYDDGQISFYDIANAALIYSFTECCFTEELYPYLNPCDNEYGSNLDPLIIVPVSATN
ncbi:E3 ubiquitin-protein ligase TRIM7-like [Parambassis ranga]|uniref:E3 ubiquitin-protein ligase TRIM7-like n=1 Tax=Parambassis ranga TaxID=210632 RepID=A0A6P7KDM8_9TELE|nr:E3 ubiquitin-protein ligase TRIM7-like [Parambassis ranga]